jgi:hypothetical protein
MQSVRCVVDTTLCDKVCQWLAAGRWFSPGTLVSSTCKIDHHDITEILLKVALNTITLNPVTFSINIDLKENWKHLLLTVDWATLVKVKLLIHLQWVANLDGEEFTLVGNRYSNIRIHILLKVDKTKAL